MNLVRYFKIHFIQQRANFLIHLIIFYWFLTNFYSYFVWVPKLFIKHCGLPFLPQNGKTLKKSCGARIY